MNCGSLGWCFCEFGGWDVDMLVGVYGCGGVVFRLRGMLYYRGWCFYWDCFGIGVKLFLVCVSWIVYYYLIFEFVVVVVNLFLFGGWWLWSRIW